MSRFQKIVIVLILLLPVIVGLAIVGLRDSQGITLGTGAFRRIGLVRIEGVIGESADLIRQFRTLRLDNSVAGVIVRVDSPGGAVAPSQEIFAELMRFREAKKPLVVSMGSVAASGGYYVAAPAQRIFADPGTITGSIGVIFTVPLFKELTKKIGVEFRVLKAGQYKDIGSPYREMSEREQKLLDGLLEDTHDQFIADVAKARGMARDTVAALADGRIFTGRQARAAGLVDSLGGFEDALGYVRDLTGLSSRAKVIERRQRQSSLRDWLVEEFSDLLPFARQARTPLGLQYLFLVGE